MDSKTRPTSTFKFSAIVLAMTASVWAAPLKPAAALSVSERAAVSGLAHSGITQGRNPVVDLNGDHRADTLLNAHNEPGQRWWLMLQRADGTFARSNGIPFFKYDLHGCTGADWASPGGGPDGRIDLFCTVGADGGQPGDPTPRLFPKQLWVQGAVGSYTNLAVPRGLSLAFDRMRDAQALDIDADGVTDLVTAAVGSPTHPSRNRAFLNRGGRFTELSAAAFPAGQGSECVAVLHRVVSEDAHLDDVFYCQRRGLLHLKNTGRNRFVRAAGAYTGLGARKILFGDLDGANGPDLVVLTASEVSVWLNNGDDAFPSRSFRLGLSQGWALAVCRIDADTDLDLFVAQGKDPHEAAANRQDFALLNNGTGRAFARFNVGPAAMPGNADWAACFEDYRGSGFGAVYVTNGKWLLPGPNRFYVFAP